MDCVTMYKQKVNKLIIRNEKMDWLQSKTNKKYDGMLFSYNKIIKLNLYNCYKKKTLKT